MKTDEAARLIEDLFDTWAPSLVRYAYRGTGSHEAAEDMVQEVFMSLYRSLVGGKQIDNLKGWTLNAVRNQVCKHERNQTRHGQHLDPHPILDRFPAKNPQPFDEVPEPDITPMLSVLSHREMEVILLRMQALKYREIGSQLGISPKTVNALITRALQKLQRLAGTRTRDSIETQTHARQTLQ
jgi:RNA polymerase sigma factor (sigma-70 family)